MSVFAGTQLPCQPETPTLAEATADFFYGSIGNDKTRRAYRQGLMRFWTWARAEGVTNLATLRPRHIGAFVRHIETYTYDGRHRYDVKTVKLTLAAVRAYFRYLSTTCSTPTRRGRSYLDAYV